MKAHLTGFALSSTLLIGLTCAGGAQAAGRDFDPEQLALTYHKLAGKPFDFDR